MISRSVLTMMYPLSALGKVAPVSSWVCFSVCLLSGCPCLDSSLLAVACSWLVFLFSLMVFISSQRVTHIFNLSCDYYHPSVLFCYRLWKFKVQNQGLLLKDSGEGPLGCTKIWRIGKEKSHVPKADACHGLTL